MYYDIKTQNTSRQKKLLIVNEVSICFSISFSKYCAPLYLYCIKLLVVMCRREKSEKITHNP